MARREELLEQLEETVFALMMEEVIRVEGRKALEENERLKNDALFAVPETTYRSGLDTIRKHFSKNTRRTAMRTMSKLISRVAVIILILLLLFTTAFATIPELRAKTLNLIMEVFDDRTRIEFGVAEQRAHMSENDYLVGWVPDGFELVDKGETEISAWEKYCNSEGVVLEVNICSHDSLMWEVDTEDASVTSVIVNDRPAMMIIKKDCLQFVCPIKEKNTVYHIRGEAVWEKVLFQMAESISIE